MWKVYEFLSGKVFLFSPNCDYFLILRLRLRRANSNVILLIHCHLTFRTWFLVSHSAVTGSATHGIIH